MIHVPLDVYRIDMKYIRNLHNIDDRVLSVFPQIGKDQRPFLGVIVICNEHKYCVPLSKPKRKHEKNKNNLPVIDRLFLFFGNIFDNVAWRTI